MTNRAALRSARVLGFLDHAEILGPRPYLRQRDLGHLAGVGLAAEVPA